MPAEFDLIQKYFACHEVKNPVTELGIGDDCALLSIPSGYRVATTVDTMVEGVHFFADVDPFHLGHKLLAVNLSDLASMGAEPVAVMLALTLPEVNERWLKGFSAGLMGLAQQFNVDLIGGDTTTGPLTLSIQAIGLVPEHHALLRSNAQADDLIYVSGDIGEAGLGLKIKQGYQTTYDDQAFTRFNLPMPRIETGLSIRHIANACIDISDGLAADLGHILAKSNVGATLEWDRLPLSQAVKEYIEDTGDWQMPLITGDDYELCFTVPEKKAPLLDCEAVYVGRIDSQPGLRIMKQKQIKPFAMRGFEHFAE